ncbi:hypothetical protein MKY75_04860 [Paenibacillus sp. FSL L8-0663]|uniref:hypothetical protein n=1 Tax=Paenibacillus sp. FSL L8-0663 TaxID=2921606 RepID=UPI0030FBC333
MEKAMMVDDLRKLTNVENQYQRLYYGQEFCPRTFLTVRELKSVISFCEQHDMKLTLITPYMTDESMNTIVNILKEVSEASIFDELVVNDFGMLYFIENHYPGRFKLILGRLLNKAKKSPSIANYFPKLDDDSKIALQNTAGGFVPNIRFMRKYKISAIQYDNRIQGNKLDIKDNHDLVNNNDIDDADTDVLPFSRELVYPYVHITTARRCFSSILYSKSSMSEWKTSSLCNKSCKTCQTVLYNDVMKKDIILKGNSLYYENAKLPVNLAEYSRIITQVL